MSTLKRHTLKTIFTKNLIDQDAIVKGWVRSVRKSKKFSFITLSDGSCQTNLQIIADADLEGYDNFSTMLAGTCVSIEGKLVQSGGKTQGIEMQASKVSILGPADATYPLQKKAASLEFLRDIAHLRPRTNLFGAVFRIRHELAMATHNFFNERGFFYLNAPIITSNDGEGAGEMFKVTTFDLDNVPKDAKGEVDYNQDYFAKQTGLTVTGQLEGEAFALGLGAIYTFGPTFRAENSNTTRHLAEFWHIEPEIAFAELEDVADLAADFVQYLIGHALDNCRDELQFLMKWNKNPELLETLENVRKADFIRITYTEAIDILNKSGQKFEFPTNWGDELQTEHEKYLTDVHYKLPVIVTDYPAACKAFYMKQNPDGKTVRAMDVLVPGVGEIIGGSQREEDYDKICKKMDELEMDKEDYWWYLDLRKYGSAPHGGFGLGFERMLMYVTGMQNIRDVIPFPRTPRNAEF